MSRTPEPDDRPRAREDVVFRRVGHDWLLFDPRAQEIHVLNLSAALAWSFCDGEHTEAEIADGVARAFAEEGRADTEGVSGGEEEREAGARKPEVLEIVRGFREAGLLQ